jgi:hypothetical protein
MLNNCKIQVCYGDITNGHGISFRDVVNVAQKDFQDALRVAKILSSLGVILDMGRDHKEVELQRLLPNKKLAAEIGKLVLGGKVVTTAGLRLLHVNYNKTLERAVTEARLGEGGGWIATLFKCKKADFEKGEQILAVKFYHRHVSDTSFEGIVGEMDKDGFRPATFRELLAFGIQNLSVQGEVSFKIYALGSVMHNGMVGELYLSRSFRAVLPRYWNEGSLFLAVSKS